MGQVNGPKKQNLTPIAPPTVLLGKAPIATAPKRCPVDPIICYAVDGFPDGLEKVGFDMESITQDLLRDLKRDESKMPEPIWRRINLLSCDQQAKVIMESVRNIHLEQALYNVRIGSEVPLGALRGAEHLALPIELAGAPHFFDLLEKTKPVLPRLGLDKGATQGKTGGVAYPSVEHLFYKNRAQFFRVYGLETYDGMFHFLQCLPSRLPDWPRRLAEPFRNEEIVLDAINQIAIHY